MDDRSTVTRAPGHTPAYGAVREHERDARRRYHAALAVAIESLRRAEQRFDESSAVIDAHIDRALAAAVSLTGPLVAAFRLERIQAEPDAAALSPVEELAA